MQVVCRTIAAHLEDRYGEAQQNAEYHYVYI